MNPAEPRRIIYDEDGHGVRNARPGSVEEDLRAWVDRPLSRIPIDTYAWCVALPEPVTYASRVAEVYGSRFPEPPDRVAAAITELAAAGTDVLAVVADQAHKHGVEFVAGIRMGDTHHRQPDPAQPLVSQFLLDHPEYSIARSDGVAETALDYGIPAVRQRYLAILGELARRRDIDGLELDFTRWGKYFPRDEAPRYTDIMTGVVADVRRMLDEAEGPARSPRPTLGVKVFRSLELNRRGGLDVRAWVTGGLLDYLIQCDWNCSDPQIPVWEFAEFCHPTACTHHVRMGSMMAGRWAHKPHAPERRAQREGWDGYGGMQLDREEARGVAANIYGFGADGIGLWNLCCSMGESTDSGTVCRGMDRPEFHQYMCDWANAVADRDQVLASPRTYHFLPLYKGERLMWRNYPVNELRSGPAGEPAQIVIFHPETRGFRQVYRFAMADGAEGRPVNGALRVRICQATAADSFRVDLNGNEIPDTTVRRREGGDDELPFVWYETDLHDCRALRGRNELGLTMLTETARDMTASQPTESVLYEPFPYVEELVACVEGS